MIKKIGLFLTIIALGAFLRFTGLNWDQNQHLHPDERFLTMVAGAIRWPQTLGQYFDTNNSPLNPQNNNFDFFVYGTFPLFLVKFIAELIKKGDYNNLTLVGRYISSITDVGTMILVFFITRRITRFPNIHEPSYRNASFVISIMAMFFYAVMTLPIQLSHFFAVDPLLTFFLTLSFLIILYPATVHTVMLLGVSMGLAISSKITAVFFFPVIALAYIFSLYGKKTHFSMIIMAIPIFFFCTYVVVRTAQPYLFTASGFLSPRLNPKITANWKQLKSFDNPDSGFPPSLQWVHTKRVVFPFFQMGVWGLGIPISLLVLFSLLYFFIHIRQTFRQKPLVVMLFWIAIVFGYQSMQFAKALRYFYPIYPAIAVLTGLGTYHLYTFLHSKFYRPVLSISAYVSVLFLLMWPLSFISIFTRPHTRVAASNWIYENIPAEAVIAQEHWDDGLPLCISGFLCHRYTTIQLPLYDPDTQEKWKNVQNILNQADYLFLTSNRLSGSISQNPIRYPQTTQYYKDLFSGNGGFIPVAQFVSRPTIPLPIPLCISVPGFSYGVIAKNIESCQGRGIQIIDDYADETWTVYDHPKVIIFKKK